MIFLETLALVIIAAFGCSVVGYKMAARKKITRKQKVPYILAVFIFITLAIAIVLKAIICQHDHPSVVSEFFWGASAYSIGFAGMIGGFFWYEFLQAKKILLKEVKQEIREFLKDNF